MNSSIERYLEIPPEILSQILEIRHHLHRHPEPSWHEKETTAYIKKFIGSIDGVEMIDLGNETGVIAIIRGGRTGDTVALRADIDALRVVETWDSPYKSLEEGRGHLCGHDFHTAALCGAAAVLAKNRDELPGNVLLIFQPAEETTNGAKMLIERGLYRKYPFSAVFGLHNRPEVETGKVVVKQGPLMAAKINFKISVHGLGGHGSMPHKCIDPIVCAAAIVQTVLTIPSRNTDPMQAVVLSICSIHGGTPDNLIVDTVEMTGSMRYLDKSTGDRALERLRTVVAGVADTYECKADFEIVEQVDSVDNNAALTETAHTAAHDALGPDCIEPSQSCLATEDFSAYMQCAPGWFYWLGSRKKDEKIYSWHNSNFHVDDDALPLASRILMASAWRFLMK